MIAYRVHEDNGGGVHMIVTDSDGIRHLFASLEQGAEIGLLRDMIGQLRDDPDAWTLWDGWEDDEISEADAIAEIEEQDDLIAWSGEDGEDHFDLGAIGASGRYLLGIGGEGA